jgi:hypothetical protein
MRTHEARAPSCPSSFRTKPSEAMAPSREPTNGGLDSHKGSNSPTQTLGERVNFDETRTGGWADRVEGPLARSPIMYIMSTKADVGRIRLGSAWLSALPLSYQGCCPGRDSSRRYPAAFRLGGDSAPFSMPRLASESRTGEENPNGRSTGIPEVDEVRLARG